MVRRIAAVVCLAAAFAVAAPTPANAHHTLTACNNDSGNFDEIFIGAHNVAFVGVDVGIDGLPGTEVVVACVVVLGSNTSVFVDHYDPPTAGTGRAVEVRLCTSSCTTVLDQTGVDLKLTTPLFSCVWINGTQQNPGCTL